MSQDTPKVEIVSVSQDVAGQRLDNFLFNRLKGVPKGHVYRLLRSGQVRVNKGRKKAHYRLAAGDEVRIPPVRFKQKQQARVPEKLIEQLEASVLHEDEHVLVINKPSGIPVHAGSGYHYGVIDGFRNSRPDASLELVHRLDRETSGCLLLAKSRQSLNLCHQAFRNEHDIRKAYLALVMNHWQGTQTVDAAIAKVVRSGERMMQVSHDGQRAVSHFECNRLFDQPQASLMSVDIETGRTHQIRVHAREQGHPLAGDTKYGDRDFNSKMKTLGLNRLFLHAEALQLELPGLHNIDVSAPLPRELEEVLRAMS